MSTDEAERDLVRQGERTVDNLKRLYAFVFAISFGAAGLSIIDRLKPLLVDQVSSLPGALAWLVDFEMVVVFGLTASVFFHQGAKFLDNRYAKSPLTKPHPLTFAWDYLTLVATMMPFFFMAQALHPSITDSVGYIWFFWAYVSLLAIGLILLVLSGIRHSEVVRRVFPEHLPDVEIRREADLRSYWLRMNGTILFLMMSCFTIARITGARCPMSTVDSLAIWFVVLFGALAFTRDVLDYTFAWNLTFPSATASSSTEKTDGKRRPWSYVIVILALAIVVFEQPWDVAHWAGACSLQSPLTWGKH